MKRSRLGPHSLQELILDRPFLRYSMVSVVAVAVSQVVLFTAQFFWSARTSNIVAVCVSAIPSYQLNRQWVWGKSGRSHVMREIVPFWTMALAGLVLSTWFADFAATNAHQITASHLGVKIIVNAAAFTAFGVLWVGKFLILNRFLFAPQPAK